MMIEEIMMMIMMVVTMHFFCRDSTWCQFSEQLSSHLLYGGMYSENRHIANNSSNTDCGSSTSSCSSCSSRYHFCHAERAADARERAADIDSCSDGKVIVLEDGLQRIIDHKQVMC